MRKFSCLSWVILFAAVTISPIACSDASDASDEPDIPNSMSQKAQEIYDKLNNTTWALISSPYEKAPLGNTITFTSVPVNKSGYQLYCSYFPNDILGWYPAPDNEGDLVMTCMSLQSNSSNTGKFIIWFGSRVYVAFSGDRMILTPTHNSDKVYVYSRTSNNSGDNSGEGNYEKPDVGFYDYTQLSKSSVKVDFIIYNKDEAGVTSAAIKYGTTSNANSSASTNISGKHAIATISGLKSNTKYYVKCTVKGKEGSVTTDAVTISLTSW